MDSFMFLYKNMPNFNISILFCLLSAHTVPEFTLCGMSTALVWSAQIKRKSNSLVWSFKTVSYPITFQHQTEAVWFDVSQCLGRQWVDNRYSFKPEGTERKMATIWTENYLLSLFFKTETHEIELQSDEIRLKQLNHKKTHIKILIQLMIASAKSLNLDLKTKLSAFIWGCQHVEE